MGLEAFLDHKWLSQAQLGRDTGISQASLCRKVTGKAELTVGDPQKIWQAY